MKRQKIKEIKAITLISLVITVILLLILAGITIAMLMGENGLINKTDEAKIESEIGTEKEQLSLAMTSMRFENETNEKKLEEIFQKYLDQYAGEGKTKAYNVGEGYTVHFIETNRVYTIDRDGNIKDEDLNIIKEDSVAGAFEGTGTEKDPFVIMSIEDLVYFANQVNSGTNNYVNQWIVLGKPLDFKSELSYKNVETTYKYDEETSSYIPDEDSDTTLKELCTTEVGFIPINNFSGNFDGQNYTISNIYEKRNGMSGLFATVISQPSGNVGISNLTIMGNITSIDDKAGGIIGQIKGAFTLKLENCNSYVNVKGATSGGLIRLCRY